MEFEVYRAVNDYGEYNKELYISGNLRFDNCMNWKFKDENYTHFCGLEGAKNLYNLLEFIYELGEKTIPSWLYYDEIKIT